MAECIDWTVSQSSRWEGYLVKLRKQLHRARFAIVEYAIGAIRENPLLEGAESGEQPLSDGSLLMMYKVLFPDSLGVNDIVRIRYSLDRSQCIVVLIFAKFGGKKTGSFSV